MKSLFESHVGRNFIHFAFFFFSYHFWSRLNLDKVLSCLMLCYFVYWGILQFIFRMMRGTSRKSKLCHKKELLYNRLRIYKAELNSYHFGNVKLVICRDSANLFFNHFVWSSSNIFMKRLFNAKELVMNVPNACKRPSCIAVLTVCRLLGSWGLTQQTPISD